METASGGRLFKYLAAAGLLGIVILSLVPAGSIPRSFMPGWVEHLIAYFCCAFVIALAFADDEKARVIMAVTTMLLAGLSVFLIALVLAGEEWSIFSVLLVLVALVGGSIVLLRLAFARAFWGVLIIATAMSALAGLMELGQFFSPGRMPQFVDFFASSMGGLCGAFGGFVARPRN